MKPGICPSCGAVDLIAQEQNRAFAPPGAAEVVVTLLTSICQNCGAQATTRDQRARNLGALAARKKYYGEWLTGEEVLSLRKKYGITQQQASEIFGKGKIAFSRYENEVSYPDLAMTRLMRLALDDARVMKQLAAAAKVELPLLEKRLTAGVLLTLLKGLRQVDAAGSQTRISIQSIGPAVGSLAQIVIQVQALTQSAATGASTATEQITTASNDERFALAA